MHKRIHAYYRVLKCSIVVHFSRVMYSSHGVKFSIYDNKLDISCILDSRTINKK